MPIIPRDVSPLHLPGRVSCSRLGNTEVVRLAITDDVSRTLVLEAAIDLTTFAKVLFGQGELPCGLRVFTGAPWGLVSEHKEVPVLVPRDFGMKDSRDKWGDPIGTFREALLAACAEHMDGGWQPNLRQAVNPHCWLQWHADGLGERRVTRTRQGRQKDHPPRFPGIFRSPADETEGWSLVPFTRYVPRTPDQIATAEARVAAIAEGTDRDGE